MDSDSNLKQVDVGIAASHWRDWLRLCMTPLLGFHAQKVLIDALGGPRQVFEQPIDMLRRFVSEAQAQSLQVIPTEWSAVCERTEVWLQQTPQGVLQQVWTWDHPRYPQMLRDTQDPPWLLYAQGQLQHACWQGVAMVGIHSVLSRGCHALLRQGAKLVETAHDVMEELPFVAPELPLADPLANEVAFTDTKLQAVYKVLNHEPQHLDSVLLNSGLSLEEALIALQQLQDINRVVALPGGLYQWLHR